MGTEISSQQTIGGSGMTLTVKRIIKNNNAALIFLMLFIFAAVTYDTFLNKAFIINLFTQNTMIGFVAFGMTFVILTGGIDLSVGSMLAICGIVAARMSHMNIFLVVIVTLGLGALLGAINGFMVVKLKIVPFIATLAIMIGLRGYIHLTTGSKSVPTPDRTEAFKDLARGEILDRIFPELGIQNSILWFVILLVLGIFILKYTRLGRHIYAVGGNAEAARMMGINTSLITWSAYIISGLMAAVSGLVMTSRLGSGQWSAGNGWEMYAIASTVIGGTLITGGKGKLGGTFFGVLILGIMRQIFNLQGNLNTWWQNIATGVILLAVVIIQSRAEEKKA